MILWAGMFLSASYRVQCRRHLETQALQGQDKATLQHIHDPALSPGNNGHHQETQIHLGLAHFLGSLPNLRRPSHQSSRSLKKQKNFPGKK
jgi:hypothetical protein